MASSHADKSWRYYPRSGDSHRVRSIYDDDVKLVAKRRPHRRAGSTVASPVRAFYDPDRRCAMPRPSWGRGGHIDPATGGEPEIPLGLDFKYRDLVIAYLFEVMLVLRGRGYNVTLKEQKRAYEFVTARDRRLPSEWLSFDDACWICGIDPDAAASRIFEEPRHAHDASCPATDLRRHHAARPVRSPGRFAQRQGPGW